MGLPLAQIYSTMCNSTATPETDGLCPQTIHEHLGQTTWEPFDAMMSFTSMSATSQGQVGLGHRDWHQ